MKSSLVWNSLIYLGGAAAVFALPLAQSAAQAPAAPPPAMGTPLPGTPPVARPTPPQRTPESAVTPLANPRNARRHAQFLDRTKEGEVGLLFLGDSITDFWPRTGEWSWLKFAPYHPANFGISGERTEEVLWRVQNGELEGISPKVTVLMIGTNNISQPGEKPEWAAVGIAKIVETIHEKLPQTKVLLLGVFPRDDRPGLRQLAEDINPIIAKLDDGNKTRYLNINKAFLTDDGVLTTEIMPDKLHPSPKGYDLWYEAMRPTLEEMMK